MAASICSVSRLALQTPGVSAGPSKPAKQASSAIRGGLRGKPTTVEQCCRWPCTQQQSRVQRVPVQCVASDRTPAVLNDTDVIVTDGATTSTVSAPGQFVVQFDNSSVKKGTVVTIQAADQANLLRDVTQAFTSLNLTVLNAEIRTEGDRVVDIFLVADKGKQIDENEWPRIRDELRSSVGLAHQAANVIDVDEELEDQKAFLAQILDDVIAEHGPEGLLDKVMHLRDGFASMRQQEDPRARASLLRFIEKMDVDTITAVVRSFYCYSSLLNIAEESYLHRKRRQQVRDSNVTDPLWYASFDDTYRRMKSKGVKAEDIVTLFGKAEYMPVFTAHPTEARRRVILQCLHRIFEFTEKREDPRLSEVARQGVVEAIRGEVEILWKTDEMRSRRPTVVEEIQTGLNYFRLSLFDAVCTTYAYADSSLMRVYGEELKALNNGVPVTVPSFIQFGSWIGGDRDGNPYVTPETTELAALLQSRLILAEYIRRVRAATNVLTHSSLISPVSSILMDSLSGDEEIIKNIPAFQQDPDLFATEPYRKKLRVMRHRLEQMIRIVNNQLKLIAAQQSFAREDILVDIEFNLDDIPGLDPKENAYESVSEFLRDLRAIRESLIADNNYRLALTKVNDLLRLGETFGFHLMALDIRQESTTHSEAVAELLSSEQLGVCDNYADLSDDERLELLAEQIEMSPLSRERVEQILASVSESTRLVLNTFVSVGNNLEIIGREAVASYVISMTKQASNVMEVLFLSWLVARNLLGVREDGTFYAQYHVTPLFETIPDLAAMPRALRLLMNNGTYRKYLAAVGNVQEVMLGYSDSCKDGGIISSATSLYQAQQVIMALCKEEGLRPRIFHGRGGTFGRGAGPTHQSIMGQPPGSVDGTIKFTEQGEVITYRYGNAETAVYELTVGVTALLKASLKQTQLLSEDNPAHMEILKHMAAAGEKAYRELTDQTEGFYDFFYEATVVEEIGLMNIGSRPARRKAAVRDKSSLRAIPWVFGWAQSRAVIPAWYGVGSAILGYTENNPDRILELQKMYRDWPFFRNFLSNVQMSLYKADMEICREYARLCKDRITQQLVFDLMKEEYLRTKSQLLMVTQLSSLLEDNPALEQSLDSRNRYLDPLNHIQVILLGRRRDMTLEEAERQQWEMPLLRSIKAIASNMRNTG
eukprot:jgi/Chlat1/4695/Chrsp3S05624